MALQESLCPQSFWSGHGDRQVKHNRGLVVRTQQVCVTKEADLECDRCVRARHSTSCDAGEWCAGPDQKEPDKPCARCWDLDSEKFLNGFKQDVV